MAKRRKFARDFKLSAVQLVNQKGYTPSEAAKSLGVDPSCLYAWIEKFGSQPGQAPAGEGALQAEVRQLRRDNARLVMERDILKKAAAYFAREQM
jgi:transposase